MEPWKGRVAGRLREWENVHWRRFPLNLTKVCPWSLPSTTYLAVLRWSLVSASLCATLCTHSHYTWRTKSLHMTGPSALNVAGAARCGGQDERLPCTGAQAQVQCRISTAAMASLDAFQFGETWVKWHSK